MFCTECGATLKPGVRFCNLCGKPVALANSGPGTIAAPSIAAPSDDEAVTVIENAPVSSVTPLTSSSVPPETPPLPSTSRQAETQILSGSAPAVPAYEAPPAPAPLPQFDPRGIEPFLPPTKSESRGNSKGILLICVAVLGLALGGLAYWFFLRKPAMNGAPSNSSASRITTTAPNKPSALESSPPPAPAAQPQSAPQPQDPNATEPKKEDASGVSPNSSSAVPGNSSGAPASAPGPSLQGKWQGEYTNHDANEIIKVTLQIAEDNSPDRVTGTLRFDAEASNTASCSITGVYNPHSKFMLLNIGNCQGNPPAYFFEGKIGFSSVELTARQVFGVDLAHNTLLNISRQ